MACRNPPDNGSRREDSRVELITVRDIVDQFEPPVAVPIILDLTCWSDISTGSDAPNDLSQIKALLQYFVEVAGQNGLSDTPAATKLNDAIFVMERVTPATSVEDIPIEHRVSFDQTNLSLT